MPLEVVSGEEDEGFGMEEITSGIVPYLCLGCKSSGVDTVTVAQSYPGLHRWTLVRLNGMGSGDGGRRKVMNTFVLTLAIVIRVREKVATSIRQADDLSRTLEDDLYREFSVFA